MALEGYTLRSGYLGVLNTLGENLGEVETSKTELKTSVEDAKTAVKSSKISEALTSLHDEVVGANSEAAWQRGTNARDGAAQIRRAIIQSDQQMADDAYSTIQKTPDFHER
ncbi:DUF6507 family protein [Zhihengliuella sp.]|uniref:DUF6507 family protein n=1 Tax=Zhihengliuella sp. TaxID=1954483 RepID=UPI002811C61C|nr:DUF6507 family protein [Zhihengliuella sp.]